MPTKSILIAVLSALIFAAGWTVSSWHSKSGYAKTLQAALEQQKADLDKANSAAIELERTRAAAGVKAKTITKRVEVYLEKKPPTECFDSEALRIFNEVS